MTPALLALALFAGQAAPALDGQTAKEPNIGVAALTGGAAATAGTLLVSGAGLLLLASADLTGNADLLAVAGTIALVSTPLVTALAAGTALNLLYGEDCSTYFGVFAGGMMACLAAYACAAAVAVFPLLLLAGSGGGSGCSPSGCNGCGNDPCGSFGDFDFARSPRDEVMGGMMGAGIGLAVGSITGAFFPFVLLEAGGTLPTVGLLGNDPTRYAFALGASMGLLLAGVGSAIGVAVSGPDEVKKSKDGKTTTAPRKTALTYEVPLGPSFDAALGPGLAY